MTVGLITRRSQVQILSPPPKTNALVTMQIGPGHSTFWRSYRSVAFLPIR
jgi:hypothetical protein